MMSPESLSPEQESVFLNDGDQLRRAGKDELALKSYEGLVECLLKQGKVEEAIAAYQKAVDLNPGSETFRQNLEKVLAENGNFPMKNMSSYATSDQFSEINPDRKYAVFNSLQSNRNTTDNS